MNERELNDKLWDLVYGLLDEQEEAALEEQIQSDPVVARRYAEVSLEAELVATAAKIDRPALKLQTQALAVTPASQVAANTGRFTSHTAWLNLGVSLVALSLLAVLGWAYRPHSSIVGTNWQVFHDGPQHREVVFSNISGPAQITAGTSNRFRVQAWNAENAPIATTFNFTVDDGKEVRYQVPLATNDEGWAEVEVPGEALLTKGRLVVSTDEQQPTKVEMQPVVAEIDVQPDYLAAHLEIDRPIVKPGETVFFRAVTLGTQSLVAQDQVAAVFELLDPKGKPVPGSRRSDTTSHGVAAGEAVLPSNAPEGYYEVRVRSPNDTFEEQRVGLLVRKEIGLELLNAAREGSENALATLASADHQQRRSAGKKADELAFGGGNAAPATSLAQATDKAIDRAPAAKGEDASTSERQLNQLQQRAATMQDAKESLRENATGEPSSPPAPAVNPRGGALATNKQKMQDKSAVDQDLNGSRRPGAAPGSEAAAMPKIAAASAPNQPQQATDPAAVPSVPLAAANSNQNGLPLRKQMEKAEEPSDAARNFKAMRSADNLGVTADSEQARPSETMLADQLQSDKLPQRNTHRGIIARNQVAVDLWQLTSAASDPDHVVIRIQTKTEQGKPSSAVLGLRVVNSEVADAVEDLAPFLVDRDELRRDAAGIAMQDGGMDEKRLPQNGFAAAGFGGPQTPSALTVLGGNEAPATNIPKPAVVLSGEPAVETTVTTRSADFTHIAPWLMLAGLSGMVLIVGLLLARIPVRAAAWAPALALAGLCLVLGGQHWFFQRQEHSLALHPVPTAKVDAVQPSQKPQGAEMEAKVPTAVSPSESLATGAVDPTTSANESMRPAQKEQQELASGGAAFKGQVPAKSAPPTSPDRDAQATGELRKGLSEREALQDTSKGVGNLPELAKSTVEKQRRALRSEMDRSAAGLVDEASDGIAPQKASAKPSEARTSPSSSMATTLYWQPRVVTDTNGVAEISIPLPKEAGRYRLSVEAHALGRVGKGELEIVRETPAAAPVAPAAKPAAKPAAVPEADKSQD